MRTVAWAMAPPDGSKTDGGVKPAVRPEDGENEALRLTFPLKYPMAVAVSSMFVMELCTKVTWLVVVERLKSRGNSTIVNDTGCSALWVRPALVVPVMVIV